MRHAAELEFLGEAAVAVEFELEMEAVDTVDVEADGHESTDMHAEDFDEELGLLVAKSAFLYQAQNLQQSFGHCSSEYFEYFDYFPYCSVDCSASSGTFDGRSHPQGKNLS